MNTIAVAPMRPRPTHSRPVMPPVRKATLSAGGSLPSRAAAAVRTLPRTDRLMPMKPVSPEKSAPQEEGDGPGEARLDEAQRHGPVRADDLGGREEHEHEQGDDDDRRSS